MTKLSVEQIEQYARKCARFYISRYGAKPLLDIDDAFSIAFMALVQNSSYDETRSDLEIETLIKKRALGAIIREYQKLYGSRRKNQVKFVPINEALVIQKPERNNDSDLDEFIQKGLLQLFDSKSIRIVSAVLDGRKQADVAKEFEVSSGRVSQLFKKFKQHAQFYRSGQSGVVTVNTNDLTPTDQERKETPLFFEEKNETN